MLIAPYCSIHLNSNHAIIHNHPIVKELKRKYARDHEIAAMKNLLPGEADPNAAGVAQSQVGSFDQMTSAFHWATAGGVVFEFNARTRC